MCKASTTEEKIKEAAKSVFLSKGFSGCTSREIAKEAGMNVALVNYYFRSKNQLFLIIYQTVMHDFMLSMMEVFSTELSLKEKVSLLIDREYEFLTKHPEIPTFVLNELQLIADSADAVKQARGRRGLQVLNDLRAIKHLDIRIQQSEVARSQDSEAKLIFLASSPRLHALRGPAAPKSAVAYLLWWRAPRYDPHRE